MKLCTEGKVKHDGYKKGQNRQLLYSENYFRIVFMQEYFETGDNLKWVARQVRAEVQRMASFIEDSETNPGISIEILSIIIVTIRSKEIPLTCDISCQYSFNQRELCNK